jgi:hypothetical protein
LLLEPLFFFFFCFVPCAGTGYHYIRPCCPRSLSL